MAVSFHPDLDLIEYALPGVDPYWEKQREIARKSLTQYRSLNSHFEHTVRECRGRLLGRMRRRSDRAFDEVFPGIIFGNERTANDKAFMDELGVTHILNTIWEYDSVIEKTPSSIKDRYKFFMARDLGTEKKNILKRFNDTNDFIDDALQNGGKVFIICIRGYTRGGTVTCAYLMMKHGLNPLQAMKQIDGSRDTVNIKNDIPEIAELGDILHLKRIKKKKKEECKSYCLIL